MADAHHRLSVHSCQDRINSTCHGKYSQACHSLSKSTSSLSNQRAPLNKLQELHKSLNNVFCSSRSGRSGFQNSQTATRFWVLDGDSDLCSVEGNCNHVYVDQSKKMIHLQNHHLSADSSLAPIEQKVKSIFFKSKGSENVSLLGCLESSSKAKSNDTIATEQRCFQRSHSDFNCGKVSQDSSTPKILNKNSATYSALCSFSSISDTSCNDMCLNYAPVAVHSSTAIHNNLTAVMDSDEDFNISICHLDSNAMQQSSLVYSVPRQHRHTVLGLVNAGIDLTSNTQIYSQPHSNSPGFLSCENILNSKDSQPTKIIHNNCSLYCVESSKSLAKGDKTVAAYCHSLPIPSVQVSSGPICTPCKSFLGHTHPEFCSLLPPTGNLAFPKLVSSVSESGLDAKKLIQSGQLFFPQLPVSKGELKTKIPVYDRNELLPFTVETSSDYQKVTDLITQKKDMWTMTSKSQLFLECRLPLECRDAEVQTFVIMENKSVSTSPCLKVNSHQCFIPDVALALSAMKEVRWDDEGMTWEVYGASLDPEVLGLAIQKHLEIQIEQNLQPSEEPREIAVNKSLSGKKRSLRTVVHSLRQYSCCCCRSFTAD